MAYALGSLRLVSQNSFGIAATPRRWELSGTDSDATVLAAGYISDGGSLGVKVGDCVEYTLTTTPAIYKHVVKAVGARPAQNVDPWGGLTLGSSPTVSS